MLFAHDSRSITSFLTISLVRRHSLPSDATNSMDLDSDIDEHFDQSHETSLPRDPGEAIDDDNSAHKTSKLSVCQACLQPCALANQHRSIDPVRTLSTSKGTEALQCTDIFTLLTCVQIRCDRNSPCSGCARATTSCSYPSLQSTRRKRHKTSISTQ